MVKEVILNVDMEGCTARDFHDIVYGDPSVMDLYHLEVNKCDNAEVGDWVDGQRVIKFAMDMQVPAMIRKFVGAGPVSVQETQTLIWDSETTFRVRSNPLMNFPGASSFTTVAETTVSDAGANSCQIELVCQCTAALPWPMGGSVEGVMAEQARQSLQQFLDFCKRTVLQRIAAGAAQQKLTAAGAAAGPRLIHVQAAATTSPEPAAVTASPSAALPPAYPQGDAALAASPPQAVTADATAGSRARAVRRESTAERLQQLAGTSRRAVEEWDATSAEQFWDAPEGSICSSAPGVSELAPRYPEGLASSSAAAGLVLNRAQAEAIVAQLQSLQATAAGTQRLMESLDGNLKSVSNQLGHIARALQAANRQNAESSAATAAAAHRRSLYAGTVVMLGLAGSITALIIQRRRQMA